MNFAQENNVNGEVVIYTDERLEFGEEVQDFLPSPTELADAPRRVKVTLSLDVDTLALFKQMAKKHDLSYHELMEKLLKTYAHRNQSYNQALQEVIAG